MERQTIDVQSEIHRLACFDLQRLYKVSDFRGVGLFNHFDGTLADRPGAVVDAYTKAIETLLLIRLEPDQSHIEDLIRRRPVEYLRQHYGHHAEALVKLYASS